MTEEEISEVAQAIVGAVPYGTSVAEGLVCLSTAHAHAALSLGMSYEDAVRSFSRAFGLYEAAMERDQ